MNPATSAETSPGPAAWLKDQRRHSARWVRFSVLLSFAAGLVLIAQAWLMARIIDAVVFHDARLTDVSDWLWLILALFLVRAGLVWAAEQTAFQAAAQVKRVLRDELTQHLFRLGPGRLGGERSGEISTTLSDGVEALEAYYARYLPAMSLSVMLPLAILVVVFPFDWLSGLILLLTAPLIPLFMILIGKGAERLNQRQWRKLARLSAHFLDVIQGLTTLKLFNASRREIDNVARIADDYRQTTMAVLRVAFLSSLALEFFATVSIAVVAVSIGFRLLFGEMSFLYGFFILLLAPEFYLPLRSMGTHYHARMEAIGAAERLLHLFEIAPPETAQRSTSVPDLAHTEIELRDVGVSYPGGVRALDGVTLTLHPGERLALVGPSGAGKSTLFNLLLGFIEPGDGSIWLGDRRLDSVEPAAWRAQLAWVPQRAHLFAASVGDNLRIARPGATMDMLNTALVAADARFVYDLPQGLETPVGEGGVGLSGGQVQRIALARAFLRRAPLTLLDEPTAHLDHATEKVVQSAIERLAASSTVVVIAHRLNTVRNADRILLFEHGHLIDEGPHSELLQRSEGYRRQIRDFGDTR